MKCSSCSRLAYYKCTCDEVHIDDGIGSLNYADHFRYLCSVCQNKLEAIRELKAGQLFDIFIPAIPPGINQTYGYGNGKVYLTKPALNWAEKAALVIGARAGMLGWDHVPGQKYSLLIYFNNWCLDVDAPVKLIQDTLTRKLGFDDKHVLRLKVYKYKNGEKGVTISLRPLELNQLKYESVIIDTQI